MYEFEKTLCLNCEGKGLVKCKIILCKNCNGNKCCYCPSESGYNQTGYKECFKCIGSGLVITQTKYSNLKK